MSVLNEKMKVSGSSDSLWRDRFKSALHLCESVSACANPAVQIRVLNKTLNEILGSDSVFIYIVDASGDQLTEVSTIAPFGLVSAEGLVHIPKSMGRIKSIIDDGTPIVTDCNHPHEMDEVPPDFTESFRCSEMLSAPFIAGGEVLGLYCAFYEQGHQWSRDDIEYAADLGRIAGSLMNGMQSAGIHPQGMPIAATLAAGIAPMAAQAEKSPDARCAMLSEREEEVSLLVAEGLSNEEIARRLFLSLGTVKKAVSSIMRKLNLDNRVKIANYILKR